MTNHEFFINAYCIFVQSGVLKNAAIFYYITAVILDIIMTNGSRSCQSHIFSQICLIS